MTEKSDYCSINLFCQTKWHVIRQFFFYSIMQLMTCLSGFFFLLLILHETRSAEVIHVIRCFLFHGEHLLHNATLDFTSKWRECQRKLVPEITEEADWLKIVLRHNFSQHLIDLSMTYSQQSAFNSSIILMDSKTGKATTYQVSLLRYKRKPKGIWPHDFGDDYYKKNKDENSWCIQTGFSIKSDMEEHVLKCKPVNPNQTFRLKVTMTPGGSAISQHEFKLFGDLNDPSLYEEEDGELYERNHNRTKTVLVFVEIVLLFIFFALIAALYFNREIFPK